MPQVMTDEALDRGALADLLRWRDPVGVLSVYVDADQGEDPGLQVAALEVKNRLTELERRIAEEGPPQRLRALRRALERLQAPIAALTDPAEGGRGRVLFAAIGSERAVRIDSRMRYPHRVVLDADPFIHPLLEALDEGRPAGIVLVSRDEAALLDWRLGRLRPLATMAPTPVEAPHERSGPIGAAPGAHLTTPTREQREAREREREHHFLEEVAAAASRLAAEHGWERVLVSGGERLTEPLAAELPPQLRERAILDSRVLLPVDEPALADVVAEVMRAQHAEREAQLVGEIREAALGRGTGAIGLSEVLGALNEGRVAHLVYDPEVRYVGSIGEDGLLYAEGEASPTAGAPRPETRLTERMVERALATDAKVTPVEGAAESLLAESAGVAALLRW